MRKKFIILFIAFISCLCTDVRAEFSINGKHVYYDSISNTFLSTIQQSAFGSNLQARIDIDDDCAMIFIDNQNVVQSQYTFEHITPEKTYSIVLIDKKGNIRTSKLSFTFLPIIHIIGTVGYEYAETTISVDDPQYDVADTLPANIKWRGGSTNNHNKHKRNYKIKFNEDHQFFGMRNDNKWILDAGQPDVFRLRNHIATELWNDFASKPYYAYQEPKARSGVRGQVVEVFLNDTYAGIYSFTEAMDRKQMKLKKFDAATHQIHGGLWKAKSYGVTMMYSVGEKYDNYSPIWETFEAKYPKLDDMDSTDYSTLYNAINFVVNSADDEFTEQVADYFDMPVIVDYYIFINVLNAFDNRGKNMYWAVYDKTADKKITPAVWDLDCTVGQRWAAKYEEDFVWPEMILGDGINLYNRLSKLDGTGFTESLCQRYSQLKDNILSADSLKNRYTKYYKLLTMTGAAQRERNRWNHDSDIEYDEINFDDEIHYICNWIDVHMQHLNARFQVLAVNENSATPRVANGSVYSMSGQKMSSSHSLRKGIYIRDGRKYMVR